ncbi:PLP-dependent aminotransferase family protein [Paenibacillus methanolicus]|uniref:GntR family transcriptional regulator/MocR family aminotransferase n=1 Tax=Paenibacillus methanolicus TaxID=582686 RepID=A0A5S5BW37_9BACL|nr:PLP-dependent aminotransferase family protein [Paenibacillus methanolicus]TYP69823.1 GntR family transcriptional regulator/MocR family aminotransferase [Paenibacillus methanolicus]
MNVRTGYERYYAAYGRKTEALYQAMRDAIVSGLAQEGTRLPSSRAVAAEYGLSRGAVNQAYDMLYADGYVRTEAGSGTFVAYRPVGARVTRAKDPEEVRSAAIRLSAWGERLQAIGYAEQAGKEPRPRIDFETNVHARELFPEAEWKKAMYAEVRGAGGKQNALPGEGYYPLREAIAVHLRRERGIRADASRIMLTNGSMQAIGLLSMLLVTPGDAVVIENPTYAGIVRAVQAAGGTLLPARVDREGIVPEEWDARLLFVTPTRHFPTGAVLSSERRMALLDWASRQGAVVIEDDYDSTFRWSGRPNEPLKALDREDRVVYIGTFSRTMLGEQRIGYALLPELLVEPFRRAKMLFEPSSSAPEAQRALAAFIASGAYDRHIRNIRRVSGRRLHRLRREMSKRLARWFAFVDTDAGLHLFAYWTGLPGDYDRLREACGKIGIRWADGSRFWVEHMLAGAPGRTPVEREDGGQEGPDTRCALFGFAHLSEDLIAEGVAGIEAAAIALFGGSGRE